MAGIVTVGPNEALIRSGGGSSPKVVVGGRVIVLPIVHQEQRISLEVMTLSVVTHNVYTKEGVEVSVDGVAQVKIARAEEAIRTAAQQFLGKQQSDIAQVALQTMEGHQRAILGTMTVEAIYQDRESFAHSVREVAAPDMANMGLEIVSFTLRDIQDDRGYLNALGVSRTSEVKRDATIGNAEAERDATIGSAEAERDAGIRSAEAERLREAARFEAQTGIAESERDFQVKKAVYDTEVNARRAEAELAFELQAAKTRQEIRTEEVQIEVVERAKQIEIQDREVQRRERELEATVRKPAEAERYRLETVANGDRSATIARAEAEAEAIRLRGEAEAAAILAKGLAEAEAMRTKADAWKEYGEAAVVQQVLETLPEVASAIAAPLSNADRIVMFSGGEGAQGPSRLTQDVGRIVGQVPEVIESLTGIDVLGSIKNLPGIVEAKHGSGANGSTNADADAAENNSGS